MDLKFIVPKMEKTFGILEFSGFAKEHYEYVNRERRLTYIEYNLYSSVQLADNISVKLPANVRRKNFEYEERIMLVNPRLEVSTAGSGEVTYTDYIMYADDMVKYEPLVES